MYDFRTIKLFFCGNDQPRLRLWIRRTETENDWKLYENNRRPSEKDRRPLEKDRTPLEKDRTPLEKDRRPL